MEASNPLVMQRMDRGDAVEVFYDSARVKRTMLGKLHYCLSCPGWSKVTTERAAYSRDIVVDASAHQTLCQICRGEGDLVLYRKSGADLSDPNELFAPVVALLRALHCARGVARECCCALGSSVHAYDRVVARRRGRARDKKRGAAARCPPDGAEYFDLDIVVDIQAHQSCFQLCVNEGI
ncbi:hypothetical protein JL722_2273 [Aureococcus anophagefferens]|nr:hypothetical protein JL722_2273 [Aureococcus anophagefferens]